MAEKRKRGQNFSLEDKYKLIKLLLQHKETILNKKTDGATNEAKTSAWIAITNSFNSTSNTHRNKNPLMTMWEKLKSESKKYYAQMKNNTIQTGGGPLILKIDPVLEQVCSILGRGCTGILGVPDCDAEFEPETEKVHVKVICTQNDLWQTAEEANVQISEAPINLETQREEILDRTQPQIYECINIDDNLAEEPKPDNTQELQKLPINKTPLWSRRRPQISNINERTKATSSVSCSIQNVCKRKETVEDLKEQILREELEFKRKLYDLQLQAAAKEVDIKTAILDKIRASGQRTAEGRGDTSGKLDDPTLDQSSDDSITSDDVQIPEVEATFADRLRGLANRAAGSVWGGLNSSNEGSPPPRRRSRHMSRDEDID